MIGLAVALVAAGGLRYQVTASAAARELVIEARIPAFPDRDGELSVDDGAEPILGDVEIFSKQGRAALERRGDSWFAHGCAARVCPLRDPFAVLQAANARSAGHTPPLFGE